nr:tetratricopeptide repeat protein [Parvularcula dongshanensis]
MSILALLAAASAQPAAPQADDPVERAIELLGDGAYEEARALLAPIADGQDSDAAYVLAYMEEHGLGAPADRDEARRLYVSAAMAGQPDAQYELGELAYTGEGVQQDLDRAYAWFNLAATQGHARATYMLGLMHAEGQYVPQDMGRAAALYEQAAETGVPEAQFQLGVLYLEGKGRPQDDEQAAHWFGLAAEQGHTEAAYNLAVLYETERLAGEPKLEEAARLMRNAAEAGLTQASVALGYMALNGRGMPASDEQARAWFERAAKAGSPEGMYLYAASLAEGLGGLTNLQGALDWAEASVTASQGEPPAVIEERTGLRDEIRVALEDRPEERTIEIAPLPDRVATAAPEALNDFIEEEDQAPSLPDEAETDEEEPEIVVRDRPRGLRR